MAPVGPATAAATAVLAVLGGGGGLWNFWSSDVAVPADLDALNESAETVLAENTSGLVTLSLQDASDNLSVESLAALARDFLHRVATLVLVAWDANPWIAGVAFAICGLLACFVLLLLLFRTLCCVRRCCKRASARDANVAAPVADHEGEIEGWDLLEPVREGLQDVIDTLKKPAAANVDMSGIMTTTHRRPVPVLHELFSILDQNGDGLIRKAELLHAARTDSRVRDLLGLDESLDQACGYKTIDAFESMDADANGAVSRDELTHYLRKAGLFPEMSKVLAGPPSPLALSPVASPARSRKSA